MCFSVVVYIYDEIFKSIYTDVRGRYTNYDVARNVFNITFNIYSKDCKDDFMVVLSKINGDVIETIDEREKGE